MKVVMLSVVQGSESAHWFALVALSTYLLVIGLISFQVLVSSFSSFWPFSNS